MEPLTKIELGSCAWLGALAVACTIAAQLLTLANNPDDQRTSLVERENLRGANRQHGRSR